LSILYTSKKLTYEQDRWYRKELEKRGVKYHIVEGTIEERIARILEVL
jgi:hypothetical protein